MQENDKLKIGFYLATLYNFIGILGFNAFFMDDTLSALKPRYFFANGADRNSTMGACLFQRGKNLCARAASARRFLRRKADLFFGLGHLACKKRRAIKWGFADTL